NCLGTAVVLKAASELPGLSKMLVASSMSIYGEGRYDCPACGAVAPGIRSERLLLSRRWEPDCPVCGGPCRSVPTPESKPLMPTSVYAVTKRDQEELFLTTGAAYGIPAVAMRFFNVYGTRQALSNPYTGVGAIFATCFLNDRKPVIFEDGSQTRDFIHVGDVAEACLLALESNVSGVSLNIGTGRPVSVLDMASIIARKMGRPEEFVVRNDFRAGDIRHCYADPRAASEALGFRAATDLESGVEDLVSWVSTQTASDDSARAVGELSKRGLIR
ncbi:NAD-dependent epimerase/dehydratase family protein, partial [Candidatus Fermentibacterales bacterium]|nr:NAD-dependent epimerase/dehydratase family protein [Candidatus Fermentibacterales bacterium]